MSVKNYLTFFVNVHLYYFSLLKMLGIGGIGPDCTPKGYVWGVKKNRWFLEFENKTKRGVAVRLPLFK